MISKIQNLGSHLLSTDIKAKMIDDDLYYILLDEVQLVPRFEALPKISENTQIFLVEILKNTQIFLVEILENTQIFYNIAVVLPTFWWHIADYLPRKSGSGVVAYVHLLIGQQVVAHHLRLIWQQPVAKLSKDDGTHTIGEVPAF